MTNPIRKIQEDKKEYKEYMKRVKAMPKDYQFVYDKMQSYMWGFAGGDGLDMMKTIYGLIEMFEEGVAQGKAVLEITGEDVAGFCDELIKDNRLWVDYQRNKLNRKIKKTR